MRYCALIFTLLMICQPASAQEKTQVLLPYSDNISKYIPACAQNSGECLQYSYNSDGEFLAKLNDLLTISSDSSLVIVLRESPNSLKLIIEAKTIIERVGRSKETFFLTPTWSLQTLPGKQPVDLRAKANETTVTGDLVRSLAESGAFLKKPPNAQTCPEGTRSCNGFCSSNCEP